jgi:Zn-dependent M28 family amino/carboxypeptidase
MYLYRIALALTVVALIPSRALTQRRTAAATRTTPAAAFPITPRELEGHIRFLASDLLEGRAPATRGGRIAAEYIAAQLQSYGVEPGVRGSYFQLVPIDVVGADRATIAVAASGRATARLRYPEDVVIWAGSAVQRSEARGELVFIGYGVTAPEFRWDDFKDEDLKGKILLVLVGDPPALPNEPTLFGGRAMTYYGRWTYKFEEAERRGAAGMLIVHTTEDAGYPWHTVVGSWAKEQRMLPRPAAAPPPLGVRGWITDSGATALLAQAGLPLPELRARAQTREFRPFPTGIMLDISFQNSVQRLNAQNVVGIVRGSDTRLREQYVAYTAHYDHLGIGPPVNGDSIYNGAVDNASGTATILAIARAAAQRPRPRRSQLFIFVDAEESGLLGSQYFGEHATVPIGRIVANLNVDGNTWLGRVRTLEVLGDTKSSLGPTITAYIRPMGMRVEPDANPERGYFYRSDHFSFAKVGVPAVSIGPGKEYVGRPRQWGIDREEEWLARHYHQPSDEYTPDWNLSGAAQIAEIVAGVGARIANAASVPTWNRDAEFYALRPATVRRTR